MIWEIVMMVLQKLHFCISLYGLDILHIAFVMAVDLTLDDICENTCGVWWINNESIINSIRINSNSCYS